MSRLGDKYKNEIHPALMKEFGYKNIHQAPRIEKIVVSMGVKEGVSDAKAIDIASEELATITGQKPAVTRAKKAIAAFKLRKGNPIGLKVTLRQTRMYDFMDRLFNVAMPRIRDFRGITANNFDGMGNCNIGLQEQIIFPEIDFDKVKKVQGMNIAFVTTAKTKKESQMLLEGLGFPFRKK